MPNSAMSVFSLPNYLRQCHESQTNLEIITGAYTIYGKVTDIDTQGPFPSVLVTQNANGRPRIVMMAHIATIAIDDVANAAEAKGTKE